VPPKTPNRKRIGITAPDARWKLLGDLLEAWRRTELGFRSRVQFAANRLQPTPLGNANVRLVSDIENSYRPDTYPAGTLREIAQAYGVAYESVTAVLRGEADELAAAAPPRHQLPPAPMDDGDRESAVRPYATRIWDALLRLAGQGIVSPTGAQLGLDPGDAKVWDGSAGAMSLADRAWLVADIQRRRDGRNAAGQASATTA
jgi:hypothetical protein